MRVRPMLESPNRMRIGIIILAVGAALAAGVSGLVYRSPYAPLVVSMGVAGLVALVLWFPKPAWVLYAAVFVLLLPIGLIPAHVHSLLNRATTVAAFGIWLLDVITRRRRVVWTHTALLMLGFLAWSIVTLLWTTHLSASSTSLQTYALRLALFLLLVPNIVRTPETLNGLMNTLAVGGWVLLLLSAATISLEGYTPGTRFEMFDVNENMAGILALIGLIGVLWQATQPSKQWKSFKLGLAIVFLASSMGLTAVSGSRGSALSFLVALWAFWVWKPTRRWATAGLLILIVAVISAPFIFSTTLDRFVGGRGGTPLGGREAIWRATWLLITEHPWRGVGIGNAPYAVMSKLGVFRSIMGLESASIHNPVLAVFAETGILGVLLYLGVLGSALWSFWRQHRQSNGVLSHLPSPYFAIVSSVFLGYMTSWIKGGGMESGATYFLMLALLLIPSHLEIAEVECDGASRSTGSGCAK